MNKQRGVKLGTKRGQYKTEKTPTVTINFRVPATRSEEIKSKVREFIKSLK